jgi:hypothetical protein
MRIGIGSQRRFSTKSQKFQIEKHQLPASHSGSNLFVFNFPYPIFKIDLYHRNTRVNYFLDERDDRSNYWKQKRQEK